MRLLLCRRAEEQDGAAGAGFMVPELSRRFSREMTWVWMALSAQSWHSCVTWLPAPESVCSSLSSQKASTHLSQRMFCLGHSDPRRLRCCKCFLSLAQGRVQMRLMKKCLSSSADWGFVGAGFYFIFFLRSCQSPSIVSLFSCMLCSLVFLFLVYCWWTEIFSSLYLKWGF